MRTAFEFVIEYIKKSAKRQTQLSQSFRYLYNRLFGNTQKVQIYRIRGLVENSDKEVTTLFAGKEQGVHQLASIVYHQPYKTQRIAKLQFNQIMPVLSTGKTEMIAVRVEKPTANSFEKQDYMLLPNISFNLDLRRPFDDIISRMSRRRRRDIKKIEALNYSYTICGEDDQNFDLFYWKMYVPYASQRFREAAHIKGYNESKAFYRTGGQIIFVKKSENPIAGILFRIIGKTLYAISMGSCQQSEKNIQQLASQAALLFLIKWAKMKGLKNLDYGTSLPFFREGVFIYKKEWGMSLEEPIDQSYCALKLNSLNAGVLSFLEQNPFIVSDNGSLKGVVLLNHKPTNEELQLIFSEYFLPKLSSMIFIVYYKSSLEFSDKAEVANKPRGFCQVLSKPLLGICLLLQENAFRVEVLELRGAKEIQKTRDFLVPNVRPHLRDHD